MRAGLITLALGSALSVALAALIARLFFLPALGSEILARRAWLASKSVYILSGHIHLRRAGHGLLWTGVATAIVVVPLIASTNELIRQTMLESTLRSALVGGTVTFQRAELIHADFDWLTSPPVVHLLVRSGKPITPVQVRLLEAFAKRATGTTGG